MAFRGTFYAPKLEAAPCGLFSVADVVSHTARDYDNRWVRGLSFEYDSQMTLRLLTNTGVMPADGELSDSTGLPDYLDYEPFFIEVEKQRSGMGLINKDEFAVALRQLEAATQKAVEAELWRGLTAQEAANDNLYLADATKAGDTVIAASSAGVTPDKALALLEQSIANSPYGGGGVIHLTRDVASALGSRLLYKKDSGESHATTRLGTPVVIGSGYDGSGPGTGADYTPSATNKWAYVSGPVVVHLGKPEVENEGLNQGFNPATNDMLIKASRAAAVFFDPSLHYAARITL